MSVLDRYGGSDPRHKNARRQPGANTTESFNAKDTAEGGIKQRAKSLIVTLACCGLLPIPAADFIIRRRHLGAE